MRNGQIHRIGHDGGRKRWRRASVLSEPHSGPRIKIAFGFVLLSQLIGGHKIRTVRVQAVLVGGALMMRREG